ncbi:MAG: hypothetical protein PW788_05200 [Micavibrio sp.]|nr:hypothetical protein [Micavibrio sp.]
MSETLAAAPLKPSRWNQSSLQPFLDGLGPARLKEDRKKLRRLFNAAASAPTAAAALKWAKANDIKFIVDHTTRANGYYMVDTGVVAIANRLLLSEATRDIVVGTLVHEIRHGWQDKHGMIPTTGENFTDYYIRISLMEADATAHGEQAREEYAARRHVEQLAQLYPDPSNYAPYSRKVQDLAAEKPAMMLAHFKNWYTSWRPENYGDTAAKYFGHSLGIPDVIPTDHKIEFQPFTDGTAPQRLGIDHSQTEQLQLLGKSFDGNNYLARASNHDMAQILSPTLAARFFRASRKEPVPLVARVLKRHEDLTRQRKRPVLV